MTKAVPSDAPERIRDQAELQDLRWVARQLLITHDRAARRQVVEQAGGAFQGCLCPLCRHARPWVGEEMRYCAEMDERERAQ